MLLNKVLLIIVSLLIVTLVKTSKADDKNDDNSQHASNITFVQNKNQWDSHILFQADIPAGRLFLEKGKFTYLFYDEEDIRSLHAGDKDINNVQSHTFNNNHRNTVSEKGDSKIIRKHAFSMSFLNANLNVSITGSSPFSGHRNYYLGKDPQKWASNVSMYSKVIYDNIYSKIGLSIQGQAGDLKYDVIIQPGGDVKDIKLNYEGVDSMYLQHGNLFIVTSVNTLIEQKPYAYQIKHNGKEKKVSCSFELDNNTVSFKLPKGYNKKKTLVIDPQLIFSTYTGSSPDNWGSTATFDTTGNLYAGGTVWGWGYPVTIGAFQDTFGGASTDISITKFNATGTNLIYSTYFGGVDSDVPHSLIVNDNDELVILGSTSSSNFPTTVNAYDTSFNGGTYRNINSIIFNNGSDIIVAKFSSSGNLLASTYIGGSENDGLNLLVDNYGDQLRGEIITDNNNNCYVATCTQSTDFPVSATAFQDTMGGIQDACVFKLTPDLDSLIWSTYFGDSLYDAAYSLVLNDSNEVFITGGTNSPGLSIDTTVINPNLLGLSDGYVAHISNDGSTLLKMTYIGTTAWEQAYFIDNDTANNIYLFGQAWDTFPITPAGIYNNPNSGQFIQKITPTLDSIIFSTVFGSGSILPNISPTAFMVDNCEKIYVTGWGGVVNYWGATFGMPITNDAFQSSTDGSDFYIAVFQKDMDTILYGTYMGGTQGMSGDHVDGGTCRFDKKGIIYHSACAGCGGGFDDFPTTPGVWSNTNNSFNCNNAAFKFDVNISLNIADFILGFSEVCILDTFTITNSSSSGVTSYSWDFGDGHTDTAKNPVYAYDTLGTFRITLITLSPSSCNISDTIFKDVTVNPRPSITSPPNDTICLGDNTQIINPPQGGISYNWSPSIGLSDSTIAEPVASPDTTINYTLTITDTNNCETYYPVTIHVNIATADAGQDDTIYKWESTLLLASSGITYNWYPSIWLSCTNCQSPVASPDTTTKYFVDVTDTNGCTATDSVTIFVLDCDDVNVPADAGQDDTIFIGQSTFLSASGGVAYNWSPPTGLSCTNCQSPFASPDTTTKYFVVVTDSNGCTATDSVTIVALECSGIHVPNAFTPNGDNINDTIYAESSGIDKLLEFTIYNRWGEVIFQTKDISIGWDGTYKDKLQELGTYVYHLRSECKEITIKKGSITLIR